MPIRDREAREQVMGAALAITFRDFRMDIATDPLRVDWAEFRSQTQAAIRKHNEQTSAEAAMLLLLLLMQDRSRVDRMAASLLAETRSASAEAASTAARQIEDTTRTWATKKIQEANQVLSNLTEQGRVVTQVTVQKVIRDSLEPVLGRQRAEDIGVTETTSAISRGEMLAKRVAENTEAGLVVVSFWQTERDERVCRICEPLDGTPEEVWQPKFPSGPPAHPRCRCQLRHLKRLKRFAA